MRVAALIFGLIGAAGSGFLGAKWLSDANNLKSEIEMMRKWGEATKNEKLNENIKKLDRVINAAYALIGAAGVAAVASVLVLNRKGPVAAVLYLIAFAVPVAILQDGMVMIFTFGLALAMLFAVFVRKPAPRKRGADEAYLDDDDSDDSDDSDEDDRPRKPARRPRDEDDEDDDRPRRR